MNELVVRAGAAEPEDAPILSVPSADGGKSIQQILDAWRAPKRLPAEPDGIYWPALKSAWISAWTKGTGDVSGCAEEAAEARTDYSEYLQDLKQYEPGGRFYDPDFDVDFGDGYCDTCRWMRKLL